MFSALETCSPRIVAPVTDGSYGIFSRRGQFLAKAIEALNAPSFVGGSVGPLLNPKYSRKMIAMRAYYKTERRGFEPGHELEDWLEAERELLSIAAYFLD